MPEDQNTRADQTNQPAPAPDPIPETCDEECQEERPLSQKLVTEGTDG